MRIFNVLTLMQNRANSIFSDRMI